MQSNSQKQTQSRSNRPRYKPSQLAKTIAWVQDDLGKHLRDKLNIRTCGDLMKARLDIVRYLEVNLVAANWFTMEANRTTNSSRKQRLRVREQEFGNGMERLLEEAQKAYPRLSQPPAPPAEPSSLSANAAE